MGPEWSARSFTSMEVTHLVQLSGYIGGSYHRHKLGTCKRKQIKIMIPKTSNDFFHKEPHDANHRFTKSPRLGVGSIRAFTCAPM